ncbi:MAG: hypothetical protein KKH28_00305 [Elusimicrobia bacterium]|nr:hypothetical protein [Elusimicrobiota bacterium]
MSSRWSRAALPALAAAAFCLLGYHYSFDPVNAAAEYLRFPEGSHLLAGLGGSSVGRNMPLYPAFLAAAMNLGAGPVTLFVVIRLAGYALVFLTGCLLRGYWTGFVSLLLAGLAEASSGYAYDGEQSFYSIFLLLALSLLLLKRREDTFRNNILAGLAVGASMLVRTPLFLFPPLFALCDLLYGGARPGAFLRRALVFFAAAYVLLLPWGFLNKSITGKFSLFEGGRADTNLITGAKGAIYTMEGDSRRLAGLDGAGGAFSFYAGEFAKAPGRFLLTALKRLRHIFFFSPLLFGLFLVALAFSREPDRLRVFCLPLYFFLVHSLLSVEARYFYPMPYILPPLIAGSFVPKRFDDEPAAVNAAGGIIYAVFVLSLCFILFVETLVLAYPFRAARNGSGKEAFSKTLDGFPRDANLHGLKCRLFWREGDDKGFGECLAASGKFGDKAAGYFFAASSSADSSGMPLAVGLDCLVIRMLRELELGDRAAATISFRQAYAMYGATINLLRGTPYEKDREIAALIEKDSGGFFDRHVYYKLLYWPPERMGKILSELEKVSPFGGRLKLLQGLVRDIKSHKDGLQLRGWIAADIFGPPFGERGRLWKEEGKKAKELSDSAVEKMRAGRLAEAERLLMRAAEISSSNPEVFMNLCALRGMQGRKEAALQACRLAAEAVYLNPENRIPAFEALACGALMERYRLLRELGRGPEAEKALRLAVTNAPDGWAGLAAARAELKKTGDRLK